MITRPTAFILGAGASMQSQFPSGRDLTRHVIDFLGSPDSKQVQTLLEMGYSLDHIADFRSGPLYSGKASVDAFLEHREEFISVGKAAMACALVPLGNRDKLFTVPDSWYEYLYARMNCPLQNYGSNQVCFITFNYDRSLECYLHTALTYTYGISDDQAAETMSAIEMIHVQGQLARLPWQAVRAASRPYEQTLSPGTVAAARDSIRVIHEKNEHDDPILDRAQALLNETNRIIFLGFGYDPQNVKRLNLNLTRKVGYLGGTAFRLTHREQTTIREDLFANQIDLGADHLQVLQFLREKFDL